MLLFGSYDVDIYLCKYFLPLSVLLFGYCGGAILQEKVVFLIWLILYIVSLFCKFGVRIVLSFNLNSLIGSSYSGGTSATASSDTSQERTVQVDGTSEQIASTKHLVDEAISEVCLSGYIADFLVGSFQVLCSNDKSVFMWDKIIDAFQQVKLYNWYLVF